LSEEATEDQQVVDEHNDDNVLLKFQPANSIQAILDWRIAEEWPLISGWALSRLIAWSFFDQQASKRIPAGQREGRAARRPFKPMYAYKAGQLYLLYHIDRMWREYESTTGLATPPPEKLFTAIHTFLQTGESRQSFGFRGRLLSKLHNDGANRRDWAVVFLIMDYLTRVYRIGKNRKDLLKVGLARYFVEKTDPLGHPLSPSIIEKIWNQYVESAPYIYGFYRAMNLDEKAEDVSPKRQIKTDNEWVAYVTRLAGSAKVDQCIGYAAFAADALALTDTRVVRTTDFLGSDRASPPRREFDPEEKAIIESYDPKAPLAQ
jgi:hypothetical protein